MKHADWPKPDRPWAADNSAPGAAHTGNSVGQNPGRAPIWPLDGEANAKARAKRQYQEQTLARIQARPAGSDSAEGRRAKEICDCATGALVKGLFWALSASLRKTTQAGEPLAALLCYRIWTQSNRARQPQASYWRQWPGPTYDILDLSQRIG